ncbi:Protein tpx2 [Gaertneriomyces sp. JEL0708]|nr:Protein tpx2 [Gaertneriomyces sp. JEL0708]
MAPRPKLGGRASRISMTPRRIHHANNPQFPVLYTGENIANSPLSKRTVSAVQHQQQQQQQPPPTLGGEEDEFPTLNLEFNAPRFYDFLNEVSQGCTDEWFGRGDEDFRNDAYTDDDDDDFEGPSFDFGGRQSTPKASALNARNVEVSTAKTERGADVFSNLKLEMLRSQEEEEGLGSPLRRETVIHRAAGTPPAEETKESENVVSQEVDEVPVHGDERSTSVSSSASVTPTKSDTSVDATNVKVETILESTATDKGGVQNDSQNDSPVSKQVADEACKSRPNTPVREEPLPSPALEEISERARSRETSPLTVSPNKDVPLNEEEPPKKEERCVSPQVSARKDDETPFEAKRSSDSVQYTTQSTAMRESTATTTSESNDVEKRAPRKSTKPGRTSGPSRTSSTSSRSTTTSARLSTVSLPRSRVSSASSSDRPVAPIRRSMAGGPRPLTIPREFSFASRVRAKNELAVRSPGIHKKTTTRRKLGMTIPKPFNLHTTLKSLTHDRTQQQGGVAKSPFVPLAMRVKQFEETVPDRFRTKPAVKGPFADDSTAVTVFEDKDADKGTNVRKGRRRSRVGYVRDIDCWNFVSWNSVPSKEEIEIEEMRKIEPFKAKPVDKKILAGERPLGVPIVPRPQPTIPQSPAITKPRAPAPRPPSPPKIVKANPIRKGVFQPFEPKIQHRVVVAPAEFRLPGDEISRRKREEFEEKLRKMKDEEEQAKQFHAQPLPVDDPDPLPYVPMKPPTQPEPFSLETDLRGEFAKLSLQEKLQEEERERRRRKEFRAQPLPVVEPFMPQPSHKPLTDVENVVLHTDVRAEERRAYEEMKRRKEEMEEMERQRMLKEAEAREREEIRQLRQKLVHRAQPVLYDKMKPVVPKPSERKLTEPASPFIGDKRKLAEQAQAMTWKYQGGGGKQLHERLMAEAVRMQKKEGMMNQSGQQQQQQRRQQHEDQENMDF